MFNKKRLLVFLVDIVMIAAAYILAFLLRFDFYLIPVNYEYFLPGFLVVLCLKPFVFLTSGMYRSLWRYASLQDAVEILKTVSIASVMSVFGLLFFRQFEHFSRSIFILDWVLLFLMVSASRLIWRTYRETFIISSKHGGKRTLIVGAGQAGSLLLKEIRQQSVSPYNVVGFVDDDKEKRGMRLHGVPVLGDIAHLKSLVRRNKIEQVIIAIPSAPRKVRRTIIRSCESAHVSFKMVPGLTDILNGKFSVAQIKTVEIEDLLGRDPVSLDEAEICGYLTDKKVLVSGAAGSIGSEICRQVARFKPCKLVLLDNGETPLFYLEKELTNRYPDLKIIPLIADVRDRNRLEGIFDEFTPEVVIHAAAYKHVLMMEYNPVEAVINNIGGTKNLADAANLFGVEYFVMISTDKAVNPTNIMGTSKRVAEIYVQALALGSRTKFTTVRFGNVLGSNGSVIPLFREQIRNGGPVTVTDPEVIRYFMTIPEASQLVLQAGCLGNSGEIFVLDMGDPVKIKELAEELIRLSGLTPYEDIDIVYTGLRPGEKLFEELLLTGEGIKPTRHEKIKVLEAMKGDFRGVDECVVRICEAAHNDDLLLVMQLLKEIVPEFVPQYRFDGSPSHVFRRLRPDLFPKECLHLPSNVLPIKK